MIDSQESEALAPENGEENLSIDSPVPSPKPKPQFMLSPAKGKNSDVEQLGDEDDDELDVARNLDELVKRRKIKRMRRRSMIAATPERREEPMSDLEEEIALFGKEGIFGNVEEDFMMDEFRAPPSQILGCIPSRPE